MTPEEELALLQELRQLKARQAELQGSSRKAAEAKVEAAKEESPYALGFAGQSLDALKRGFVHSLTGQADILTKINPVASAMRTALGVGMKGKDPITAARETAPPVPEVESDPERYWRKGLESLGGGLATPFAIQAPAGTVLSGLYGGVGGEAGRSFAEGVANPPGTPPEARKEWAGPLGEATGSLLVGGAAGLVSGPRQTPGQQDVREALEGLRDRRLTMVPSGQGLRAVWQHPQEWIRAFRNARDFNESGSTTATAAEAFPRGSPAMKTAEAGYAGSKANALTERVQGREDDLANLGEEALRRAGPEVDVTEQANRLSDAANTYRRQQARLATAAVDQRLANATIPRREVADLYRQLQNEARRYDGINQPHQATAYREVADALLNSQRTGVAHYLQGISYNLRRLREQPVSTEAGAPAKGTVAVYNRAFGDADTFLRQRSPVYNDAMDVYAQMAAQGEEARTGLIGRLSDRNVSSPAFPTPAAKLDALVTNNSPYVARRTLEELSDPAIVQGMAVDRGEIVRAIMQKRLEQGSTNPGATVRGREGSRTHQQLAELLNAAGRDPGYVDQPLRSADMLQKNWSGLKELPEMRWWQAALRPFRTADMILTRQGMEGTSKEIASLFANPSPENMARLRELAMFDPTIRKMLMALPMANALMGQQGEK